MQSNIDSINLKELSYVLKLLLDVSFIDDGWIDENVDFEEIQQLVVLIFNNALKKKSFYKDNSVENNVKKYRLKSCEILDEDHKVYLVGDRSLLIDFMFQANLTTKTMFRKKGVVKTALYKKFHSYIRVHVLVQSKVVTQIDVKEIRLTSSEA